VVAICPFAWACIPSRFATEPNPDEKAYVADAVEPPNAVLMIPLAVDDWPAANERLPDVVHDAPKTAEQ
jgi:hypothetical protein